MSWRRVNRRRRDDEWDNEFDEFFGFNFRTNFEDLDEMIESMLRTATSAGREPAVDGPIYYGYSVNVGPDGKPHVREFGNVRPTRKGTFELGSREPFVDTVVDEKEGKLKVVAEMPGVEKGDIHLQALEDSLSIKAEHGERKYDTTVPLNVKVEPSSASASYNNGVLEVKLNLKEGSQRKGFQVNIE
jgi:HSP20 family protein